MRRRSATSLAALLAASGALLPAAPALADYASGQSTQEQQIYDYGPGSNKGKSILDSTNPLDLMNKLRKGMAMDEATPPSDAIDAALKDLEAQSAPAKPGPSAPLQGP